ncbi:cob(I)yrinic acid a,c-diamide adenosyltransferase [Thiomicrorhabdus sediminis]|uniref:Corrinoid adenosyltransferase n=1 Tax=Thiomicrorhabdus sediminis TaxID=2580412 RepID=A0A4P9K5R5_9GAMM|nr:cob(I)yrinic acid a,c-diamide adenosyltransferase [Thiomicrorhabdus sediminis]QCU90345.1 cob(I)yrinic acid a,c-diamide adenosyltransferase [Thiomicrorhabdus sediminis]
MTNKPPSKQDQYHQKRMQRKKAQIDASIAKADIEKGVMLVVTGNGKGKSTSAFGMVARALGHGLRVGVCQFIKSRTDTGEEAFFRQQENVEWHVLGDGFTWDTQDRQGDIDSAKRGWQVAETMLQDSRFDLVVLDELTYLLSLDYLDKEPVLSALAKRPAQQHVVVTGRSAIVELKDMADTVSDIRDEKHAYTSGIKAQQGVDW